MSYNNFDVEKYLKNLEIIKSSITTELYNYLKSLNQIGHIKATIADACLYLGYSKELDWLYSTLDNGQNIHTRIS